MHGERALGFLQAGAHGLCQDPQKHAGSGGREGAFLWENAGRFHLQPDNWAPKVQSTDDVIYPLWPLVLRKPLGKAGWGRKGSRAENLERMTDENRNQSFGRVDCGEGAVELL